MKNRIVSAALAVAAAVGGTLTLTGTASAQTVIAPPRVTASVDCDDTRERGTLVVSITNRFSSAATGTLRTPFGTRSNVRVARGGTETFTFPTRQSRVERGTVDVELRAGSARSTISTTYQTTDCVVVPDISATGTDSDGDGLLNSVTITNNRNRAVDVTVTAGTQTRTVRANPGVNQPTALNDTGRYATLRATRTVDGKQYTDTAYVVAR